MKAARAKQGGRGERAAAERQAPSRRGVWTLALGIAALALGAAVLWPREAPARPGGAQSKAPAAGAPAETKVPGPARAAAPVAKSGDAESADVPLPSSLEGTEVDGSLDVGEDGHLVMSARTIALFDYFFAASGEESDAVIQSRINAYAKKHLREPALGEAVDLLGSYVAYRKAAASLGADDTKGPAERLAALRRLRRDHFGDAAEALFGAEERLAEAAIAKVDAAKDRAASADDRADRIADADQKLTAPERQARAAMTRVITLRGDEETLRAGGADEEEIRRFRASTLGEEAAARLGELDRSRAAWRERVEAFRRDRDAACGQSAAGSACEARLMAASFDEREQIRLRVALESSAGGQ
ncbi:MAG: lipase secretion chaperone [Polyangiaceae bacterium]